MLDDDDAKIRRNLVVFSSLVIFAWVFDFQPAQAAGRLLDFAHTFTPLKLYITALVVLVYLAMRYKYAELEEGKTYKDLVGSNRGEVTAIVIAWYFQQLVRLQFKTGFGSKIYSELVGVDPPTTIEKLIADLARARAIHIRYGASTMAVADPALAYRGSIVGRHFVSVIREGAGYPGDLNHSPAKGLAIQISRIHAFPIWVYSGVWSFVYSGSAVKARLPVLLALAAVGALCYQISKVIL